MGPDISVRRRLSWREGGKQRADGIAEQSLSCQMSRARVPVASHPHPLSSLFSLSVIEFLRRVCWCWGWSESARKRPRHEGKFYFWSKWNIEFDYWWDWYYSNYPAPQPRHKNYLTCNQTARPGPRLTAGHKCRRFTMGRKDQLIKKLFNKETLVMARQWPWPSWIDWGFNVCIICQQNCGRGDQSSSHTDSSHTSHLTPH